MAENEASPKTLPQSQEPQVSFVRSENNPANVTSVITYPSTKETGYLDNIPPEQVMSELNSKRWAYVVYGIGYLSGFAVGTEGVIKFAESIKPNQSIEPLQTIFGIAEISISLFVVVALAISNIDFDKKINLITSSWNRRLREIPLDNNQTVATPPPEGETSPNSVTT